MPVILSTGSRAINFLCPAKTIMSHDANVPASDGCRQVGQIEASWLQIAATDQLIIHVHLVAGRSEHGSGQVGNGESIEIRIEVEFSCDADPSQKGRASQWIGRCGKHVSDLSLTELNRIIESEQGGAPYNGSVYLP